MFKSIKSFFTRRDPNAVFALFLMGMAAVIFLAVVVDVVGGMSQSLASLLGLDTAWAYLVRTLLPVVGAAIAAAALAIAKNFEYFAIFTASIALMHGYHGEMGTKRYPAGAVTVLLVVLFLTFWLVATVHHKLVLPASRSHTYHVVLFCALAAIAFGIFEAMGRAVDNSDAAATAGLATILLTIVVGFSYSFGTGVLVFAAYCAGFIALDRFGKSIQVARKVETLCPSLA